MKKNYIWYELLKTYLKIVDTNKIRTSFEDDKYILNNLLRSEKLAILAEQDAVVGDGATKEEIENTEKRLKLKLPPSYKSFLMVSNGIHWRNNPIHLLPVNDIDRLEVIDSQATDSLENDWYDEDDEVELVEYLNSFELKKNPEDNVINLSAIARFSKDLILVSTLSDFGFVLLNPKRKYKDEWEVYAASWDPDGTIAFSSFDDYLEYAIMGYLELYEYAIKGAR